MIRVGSKVRHRRDGQLTGTVIWLSQWRKHCIVRITGTPEKNYLRIGSEYPFLTESWEEMRV